MRTSTIQRDPVGRHLVGDVHRRAALDVHGGVRAVVDHGHVPPRFLGQVLAPERRRARLVHRVEDALRFAAVGEADSSCGSGLMLPRVPQ
jgi:hypothetical protein